MTDRTERRISSEQYGALCDLLHQAICEGMEEPNTDPSRDLSTGDVERRFAAAICDALDLDFAIHCTICDGEDVGYMVHDEVWQSAGFEPDDVVCIGCLTERLGRKLTPTDFVPAAGLNDWVWEAFRQEET